MATVAAPTSRVRARRQRIFRSVFQIDVSQPTPVLAATEPGEAFGAPPASLRHRLSSLSPEPDARLAPAVSSPADLFPPGQTPYHGPESDASDQVRWDRAWHVVTSRIQLPSSVTVEDSFGTVAPESQDLHLDAPFHDALPLVLQPAEHLPRATHTEDLLAWHTSQVRQHFVNHVLPLLTACAAGHDGHAQVLQSSLRTLEAAHRQYLYGLSLVVRGYDDEAAAERAVVKFRRELQAIVSNSWLQGLTDALRSVLGGLLSTVLSAPRGTSQSHANSSRDGERAGTELLGLVHSLSELGLAGDRLQVLFAETMDSCMREYIISTYSGEWTAASHTRDIKYSSNKYPKSTCMNHVCAWVENVYSRVAVQVFGPVGVDVPWTDVTMWMDVAVGRLATLRIHELYDIVLKWPDSQAAIEDLRYAVTTPQRRLQLTDTFSATMHRRLLHPGRSTLEILRIYILVIRAFHTLDHSKVLLDRVVHAIQLYLCQRDDAIRIVVTGLLSDASQANDPVTRHMRLVELAVALNDVSAQARRQAANDDGLDWNDMTWEPDPVDAGVNYKRPKNEDVIGTLINALGSQDIFIKEFQFIIAERLLAAPTTQHQETRVLNLLKKRFGEAALQNCDVMMKDIQDSRRVDGLLTKSMESHNAASADVLPMFHSRILSRLFWPSLPSETFTVPQPVAELQRQYSTGFEELKTTRKLAWLNALGTASVSLELEDRPVELECKTYEAAVIYAFQPDGPQSSSSPQQRTFNELWERLMIDEELLELALKFWVSKRVIRDLGNQTYVVIERLDDDEVLFAEPSSSSMADEAAGPSAAHPGGGHAPSPRKAKAKTAVDSKEEERRTVHWQFIKGMLTNSAPTMPLGQIAMMMKMLIPGGCPWSNEELQEFLAEKVGDGDLDLTGGKYRLPKK